MKKYIAFILSLLLLASALVGCGMSGKADNEAADTPYVEAPYDGEYGWDNDSVFSTESAQAPSGAVAENRKLIRRVSLSLETEEYDVLLAAITDRLAACGGYMEEMNADTRYSSNSRYATMTVRVPADRLDTFVSAVSEVSNVVQRSESTDDVTLAYVDTESRRDALRVEQERLMALLEKAETLADILEIESRLTDVRYQLESMESQLRTYDNLVDYATVTLSVSEVQRLTPTAEKGFWEKIGDGFVDSARSVWSGLKSLFSFVIIALPYLLVIAAFVGIVLLIIFLCIRRGRKKVAGYRPAPSHGAQQSQPPRQSTEPDQSSGPNQSSDPQ